MRHLFPLLFVAFTVPLSAATPRTNFIIILTDDLCWADRGFQGGDDDVKTPHLDALAASGLSCAAGYFTAPQHLRSLSINGIRFQKQVLEITAHADGRVDVNSSQP